MRLERLPVKTQRRPREVSLNYVELGLVCVLKLVIVNNRYYGRWANTIYDANSLFSRSRQTPVNNLFSIAFSFVFQSRLMPCLSEVFQV